MACLFPFFVDDVPVPCGKCPPCLVRRTDSWIFRIMQEEKHCETAYFVTLTYDDYHVPLSANGFMTLKKTDFQKFMKRLRFAHPKGHTPIKYYACGEYGSQFQRPHYHVILLNANADFLQQSWRDADGFMLGEVYLDPRPFDRGAIGYTCGYMNKKKIVPMHVRDDRQKEFSLMSKKMGLSYLTPEIIAYHKADVTRTFVTLDGGKRTALPRYYADRIFSDADKDARSEHLDEAVRARHKRVYDEHVHTYGNADGFIHAQNEARRAAVINFQNNSLKRLDL